MVTLYWHDYETWGEVPARDRPSQFAGVRTDEDLNIIGEPLVIYCQPTDDFLPKPVACMVTGLSPYKALAEGLPEPDFIAAIHAQLSIPGTCGVGYNSIRFDDEVTRYTLYRNFYDPYEREWRSGNSRWDIIDMVRLTHALRPQGIVWPKREDGNTSFRLEELTAANGLVHEAAHDALSDVHATIALARLIKTQQPALYQYVFEHRLKSKVAGLIDIPKRKPLLHISSMFPAERSCAAIVAPLAKHPTNANGVIVFDLSQDPTPLLSLPAEEIQRRLFTPTAELAEGESRIPLKVVHLNKSPVLATTKLIDPEAEARLGLDMQLCQHHWQMLSKVDLQQKLHVVFSGSGFTPSTDPEQQLYQGFLNDADKATCEQVRRATAEQLAQHTFSFHDARLTELLFRYKARYFPQTLSPQEQQHWQELRWQRLTDPQAGGSLVMAEFQAEIERLMSSPDTSATQQQLLGELAEYADEIMANAELTENL